MVRFSRWTLLLCVLFATGLRLFAASSKENRDFSAAATDFHLGFYSLAESNFNVFTRDYTNSSRLSEALLFQARARLEQTNYDGAISLLTQNQSVAGTNAPRFLFWLGEANFRKGDRETRQGRLAEARPAYEAAAVAFGKLAREYPASPRRLDAEIGEASARSRLSDWSAVVKLLNETNGVFQTAARVNSTNNQVVRGFLLLGEAQLAQKNYTAAELAAKSLGQSSLPADSEWQRQYLMCRIALASGRTNEALQGATQLLTLATNAVQRELLPESAAFKGSLLEQMGRTDDAIAAYRNNLVEGVSPQRQRQALWKVTELSLAQNRMADAAQVLKKFLDQFPTAPSADVALLTLGEVRLRQYLSTPDTKQISPSPTNAPAENNYLQSALDSFQEFIKRYPDDALLGNVQLNRGWCLWLQTNLPEAQAAFQAAAQLLPPSTNQAMAYFKLADCQFRQRNFSGAISNYSVIPAKYSDTPGVAESMVEPALYQIVQAGLASGNLAAATNALAQILSRFPESFHADSAVLLTGQQLTRDGSPQAARKLFSDFTNAAPTAPLLPQVFLAIARTYEQENDWTNAVHEYNRSLEGLGESPVRPQIEYYRAQAMYKAGQVTNALAAFGEFDAKYPTNELAPRARMWVADYYFRAGVPMQAEANYRMIARNTNNWPVTELTHQAELMAGKAAVERGASDAAKGYFTTLYNNTNCPLDLRILAFYALGDCFMSQDSTNRAEDFKTAASIFTRIYENYPTNRLAALAWGGKATAFFQWANLPSQSVSYGDVSNAFQQVIDATNAPIAARSQAKVGQAITLEKLAGLPSATNRVGLLTLALNLCLEVFDGSILQDGEQPDEFWRKEAGLKAGQLAENLQQWPQAVRIYEELSRLVPSARARFEKNIVRCKAQVTPAP